MYEVKPLTLTPQKAERIITELVKFETMFSDYQPACKDACGHCDICQNRAQTIARKLTALDCMAGEVWKDDDFIGIIYLTDIVVGQDARAEIALWDGDLRGKAGIINMAIDRYAFDMLGVHRVTTEVPEHMHRFISYLKRYVGFHIEGVRRESLKWKGKWENTVILGKIDKR
jgi:RimJ/RimL family protein N-acetyltransferase